jgi:hypothetical protein
LLRKTEIKLEFTFSNYFEREKGYEIFLHILAKNKYSCSKIKFDKHVGTGVGGGIG